MREQEKAKCQEKKGCSMLTGNPGKALFFFALPMILGNLFQQFYNMADSIIVGQFVGEDALAAVGASYALTNVFVMIAIGGGIGASVITSQYLGAAQYRRMRTSVSTALIDFLAVSVALAAVGLLFNVPIMHGLKTPANIFPDATLYLRIYFCGLPFLFMYNILASMFNALGDSRTPLYLLLFSSLLNIGLDLLFVTRFHWGVAGVAAATVMAQGVSALISFSLLLRRLKGYETEPAETGGAVLAAAGLPDQAGPEIVPAKGKGMPRRQAVFDWQMTGRMVRIAIPSILQQSIVSIGMLLVQSVVNGFGSSVLAGYSAGMRIESICIVPMIAMGNAMSTFTAQNIGAGHPERVRKGYWASYLILLGFAALICVVLLSLKRQIIGAFLQESDVELAFATGTSYLSFIAWFFLFIGLKAVTDGVLRGAGDVVVFTLANLMNLGIRVFVAFRFAPVWGVAAVWYAVPCGWGMNYIISVSRYLSGKWSAKRVIGEED